MKKPTPPHKRKQNKPNRKPVALRNSKKGKSASARSIPIAPANSDNPKIKELVQARNEADRAKRAYRKFIWEMIAKACAIASELRKDKKSWREFCALDWGKLTGPKVDQHDKALRFALKFIFAKGKKGEKRASFYYNAVKALVEKGLRGKALVKAIEKAGGLKKLQGQKSAKNKPRVKHASLSDESKITDPVDDPSAEEAAHDGLFGSDEYDDEMEKLFRRQMEKGEDDDDCQKQSPPKPINSQTEIPFTIIFPEHPSDLMSSKLPVRIVIKGYVLSVVGKSTVIKVDSYKLKKPKS